MTNISANFLLPITTILLLASLSNPQLSAAQSRLPKAGFSNYSTGGRLPSGSGLHLQEGADRPSGAPAEVYNPGEPKLGHKLVRWESRHMPLRVWISPGKKLPEEPISSINAQRPQEVLAMLKQDPNMLLNLPQCGGWTEQMNAAAKTGIEQWREFENEGLFSFQFVDDPAQANIFVFWAERFTGDEGVGGISTGGNTVAVLYDANQVHTRESQIGQAVQGTPVIIELQTRDDSFEQLQARVAHEFGHALGIKEHSPYNQDLMCVNGIAKMLSASDKATIRWLYKQNTPYVMLPPIVPPSGSRTLATQSQSGAEENTNTGSGTERSGGYKIRASAPDPGSGQAAAPELQYRVPKRSTIDETGAKTYERPNLDFLNEDGRSKKEREKTDSKKEEKKSRDRKKKSESTDNSGATGGTPAADPAESAQTGETQPKASDGY